MIPINILAPVAVVGVVFAFGTGYWTGNTQGKRAGAELAMAATTIAAKEVVVKEVQFEKCEAQVAKTNTAVAEQAKATAEVVIQDKAAREAAELRAIVREKEARKREAAVYQSLTELKGLINEGAVKGCFSEPVGDRFAELFNNAIAAAEGGDSP